MEKELRAMIEETHAAVIRLLSIFEQQDPTVIKTPGRADDLVGVEYIMERTGLARRSILQGKAGTRSIPRMTIRPARWRRGDVDSFLKGLQERKERQRQHNFRLMKPRQRRK
jgi:hypothetical protein